MQILVFSTTKQHISDTQLTKIKNINSSLEIVVTDNPTPKQLSNTEILLLLENKFDNQLISQMPELQWIHVPYAGVNAIIDVVKDTNIILTNSSGVHPVPISEQIFAYLLMFARAIPTTFINQAKHIWDKEHLAVFELAGKTIAIIGLGRIGSRVATLAKAFDMEVLAVKTKKTAETDVDEIYTLSELDVVLQRADFVVNCLPGTPETDEIYTLEHFKHMKPTAYFINIGRGLSVKETDLVTALQEKYIAGAGLDVFATEPLPKDSLLWDMENVLITPHHAGKTPEYVNRVMEIFVNNLQAYLDKKPLPNEVDKQKGY